MTDIGEKYNKIKNAVKYYKHGPHTTPAAAFNASCRANHVFPFPELLHDVLKDLKEEQKKEDNAMLSQLIAELS